MHLIFSRILTDLFNMNVLVFHSHNEKMKVLSFCLESQLGIEVKAVSSLEKAMQSLLGEESIDLLVVGETEQMPLLFKYLLSANARIPVIIVNKSSEERRGIAPGIHVIGQVRENEAAQTLVPMIRANYQQILGTRPRESMYCRINVELLLCVVPLLGDIYVRLSSVKYVKIFNSGSIFTEQDLKRIWGIKKIDHLYIERSASSDFIAKLQSKLGTLEAETEGSDERLLETVSQVHETIQDLANKIGFTKEVMALTTTHVEMTARAIGRSPRLSKIIGMQFMRSGSYIANHSMMVGYIACCIAAKLEWPSDSTFQKLILASLLHDVTLSHPEHAKIKTRDDLYAQREVLTAEEYAAVEAHPFAASQLVNKLAEIPSDVYLIVWQHHERPDGTGFPRALSASTIAPLAAVFIMAHDLVDAYSDLGSQFQMEKFWRESLESYGSGTFKKIAKAFIDSAA